MVDDPSPREILSVGLAGRGRSRVVESRVKCRGTSSSPVLRETNGTTYNLLRRVARVLKTEMVRSVRAIVGIFKAFKIG